MDKLNTLANDRQPNSRSTSPARNNSGFISFLSRKNDLAIPKPERSRSNPNNLSEDITPTTSSLSLAADGSVVLEEGNESVNDGIDENDSLISEKQKYAYDVIISKLNKSKEKIKELQSEKDKNVNEYLQLSGSISDKAQLTKIKQTFEKRNLKTSHAISQLQRKCESYNKKLEDFLTSGVPLSKPKHGIKEGLRYVGGNIREGVTGLTGRPKELANMIKSKFGSADNVSDLKAEKADGDELSTAEKGSSSVTIHTTSHGGSGGTKYTSEEGSECGSSATSENVVNQISPNHQFSLEMETVWSELKDLRSESEKLREEIESLKASTQSDNLFVSQALQEMRYRLERLEEQVNDLSDLHQSEVSSLRQGVNDMEDKVNYQSEERVRDIHEMLETCLTRIAKLEHQAAYTQQYVSFDRIENGFTRGAIAKIFTILLTVLQVILVVVANLSNAILPLFRNRLHTLITCVVVICIAFLMSQWAELKALTSSFLRNYRETLNSSDKGIR
ncbi:transmembrane and coiled-coil domains protein 2-like isoform X4 [Artemia franciscana]|uniref:Transmembrane and coiled-coil domains protein 1 n=2 Tax=Artemia franciscana TaxID=6661 RepID=A0AA88HFE2_ARTSF|nr:hypothetical protein QYM36_013851 [Artemia franciscana]